MYTSHISNIDRQRDNVLPWTLNRTIQTKVENINYPNTKQGEI